MRKIVVPATAAAAAAAAVVMIGAVSSMTSWAATSSYADDRSAIEDLQARYLFALDFHDPDLYVTTFTEDGVLDYGSGIVKGRKAIHDVIAKMPSPRATEGLRPAAARHNLSNIVLKIEGNKGWTPVETAMRMAERGELANAHSVNRSNAKPHLRTNPDGREANNLDTLAED